jgi:hypothetical protein
MMELSQFGAAICFRAIIICLVLAVPAWATEPTTEPTVSAANFAVKIFLEACVPNMGEPQKVRTWAESKHLQPVTAPAALGLFVGPGGKGAAWAVPSEFGSFALAIRGATEACAVWARTADPHEVERKFKTLIEGVKRPGLSIRVDQDKTTPTPVGQARSLVYNVIADGARTGFEFTMLTTERSGGAFQASLQVARTVQ